MHMNSYMHLSWRAPTQKLLTAMFSVDLNFNLHYTRFSLISTVHNPCWVTTQKQLSINDESESKWINC